MQGELNALGVEEFENCPEGRLPSLIMRYACAPGNFHFAKLLSLPVVENLKNSPATKPHYDLLTLLSYGTYETYLSRPDLAPLFNDVLLSKLRQLTVLSMAADSKEIAYSTLLDKLGYTSADTLPMEELIITAVYNELLVAKLDQEKKKLVVKSSVGRDVAVQDMGKLLSCLDICVDACERALEHLETTTMLMSVENQVADASEMIDDSFIM